MSPRLCMEAVGSTARCTPAVGVRTQLGPAARLALVLGCSCIGFASASEAVECKVTFKNTGKEKFQLFWVDPSSGKEKDQGEVQPGKSVNKQSYVGHKFSVKGINGGWRGNAVAQVQVEQPGTFRCKVQSSQVKCLFQEPKDYYQLLGLKENADDKAIKKAYRTLSVKYHPDKNPGEDARQRFNSIRDAYEVLSDTEQRILYDMGGLELLDMKKGGSAPETEDIEHEVEFTLAEAYQGVEKKIKVQRRVVCFGCRENPKKRKTCKLCNQCPPDVQMMQFRRGNMIFQQPQEVPSKENCRMDDTELTIHVERGMTQFDMLEFKHMSHQKPMHVPGNILVGLKEIPTPPFTRLGNALLMTIEITLREALLGWERKITHMDGHVVHIAVPEITRPGQILVVRREGMPVKDVPDEYGDLRLTMSVIFPKTLTGSDKEEIAAINALTRDSAKQEIHSEL